MTPAADLMAIFHEAYVAAPGQASVNRLVALEFIAISVSRGAFMLRCGKGMRGAGLLRRRIRSFGEALS